ncbi:LysM peptidoglycan-binding domain-containing protein [bacterium]|nr:LysM peptidoglycan-binding domain-containing protein [bacterium]
MKFSIVKPRILVFALISILCVGLLETRTSAVQAQMMVNHTVQVGESLSSIARNYGISVAAILQHNRIPNPNMLRVGQRLSIPLSSPPSAATSTPPIEWKETPQSLQIFSPSVTAPTTVHQDRLNPTPTPATPNVRYYTVRRGDTLQGIAVRAGVSLSALRRCNRFNGDTIYVGQLIVICV